MEPQKEEEKIDNVEEEKSESEEEEELTGKNKNYLNEKLINSVKKN